METKASGVDVRMVRDENPTTKPEEMAPQVVQVDFYYPAIGGLGTPAPTRIVLPVEVALKLTGCVIHVLATQTVGKPHSK